MDWIKDIHGIEFDLRYRIDKNLLEILAREDICAFVVYGTNSFTTFHLTIKN